MQNFSITLASYIVKKYNISLSEVESMIDDEWDFIEQEYFIYNASVKYISKELLEIYMVA